MTGQGIGASLIRKEDDRFMRGRGAYVGDLRLPGMLEVAFLRSSFAHAHQTLTISAADVETARHLEIAMNAPTAEARIVVTDGDEVVIYVGEVTYPGDVVRLNIELIERRQR